MVKIAVMGDYDSIYGFGALGLSIFPIQNNDVAEAERIMRSLAESNFGIIYITEELAALMHKEISRYANRITPAIILIPGVKGDTGEGVQSVKKSVEQAVGSDILFGGND